MNEIVIQNSIQIANEKDMKESSLKYKKHLKKTGKHLKTPRIRNLRKRSASINAHIQIITGI